MADPDQSQSWCVLHEQTRYMHYLDRQITNMIPIRVE